jgi:transposase
MNTTTTNEATVSPAVTRIKIAIDMHKKNYRVVRQLDYTAPEPPQKFTPPAFFEWLKKQLTLAGEVVVCYEAGCFGYEPARQMQALGARALVIAPQNWDEAGKKQVNDKFDARVMCQRLSNYLDGHRHALSVVRIPTRAEEAKRDVGRQRDQLRGLQRQTQAMGRSLLFRHEFFINGRWWRGASWLRVQRELPAPVVAQLRHYAAVLEACEKEAVELEEELTAQTPAPELFFGEGALSHELIHREIADPTRFKNPRAVGNYFGLCPSESTSDENRRLGSITKHGNPRLRCLLVELAWRVVFYQPGYRGLQKWAAILHAPKSSAPRKKKAIVALARQLAIDLWRVATGRRTLEELGLTRKATPPAPAAAAV